jgi:NAD(P)-dependent dehydrogenase (short-subunit alcohol dehydrogenase family)
MAQPRTVLLTGSSSGIGEAVARHLHRAGHVVYATARRPDTFKHLAADGIATVTLDLTDADSMADAVAHVLAQRGRIDVLVNNAGYGLAGTIEEVPVDAVRQQFETNVFGLLRLSQLVLPSMRAQGSGLIINVSSILGRFAVPGGGSYHATKHAVEALSDALRLEVARFGVRVAIVQPGPTRTAFGTAALASLPDAPRGGAYGDFDSRLAAWYASIYGTATPNLAGRFAVSSDDVAKVITRVVATRWPRARYPVGLLARGVLMLRRTLPDRLFDAFVRTQFPVP